MQGLGGQPVRCRVLYSQSVHATRSAKLGFAVILKTHDLKQGSGGIADIEFIVQFDVLLHAHEYPKLLQFSDTVGLLDRLPETGFLSSEAAEFLKNAYYEYRNLGHRAALQERPAFIPDHTLIEIRTQVEQIWLASMS